MIVPGGEDGFARRRPGRPRRCRRSNQATATSPGPASRARRSIRSAVWCSRWFWRAHSRPRRRDRAPNGYEFEIIDADRAASSGSASAKRRTNPRAERRPRPRRRLSPAPRPVADVRSPSPEFVAGAFVATSESRTVRARVRRTQGLRADRQKRLPFPSMVLLSSNDHASRRNRRAPSPPPGARGWSRSARSATSAASRSSASGLGCCLVR